MAQIKEDGVYVGPDGIPAQYLKGHVLPDEVIKDLKKVGEFGAASEAKVTGPAEAKVNPNPAPPKETAAQKKAREKAEQEAANGGQPAPNSGQGNDNAGASGNQGGSN